MEHLHKKMLLSVELMKEVVEYNEETGLFIWKIRGDHLFKRPGDIANWNRKYSGRPALTVKSANGYLAGGIFKKQMYAHRAAWAYVHGVWPDCDVDHINRVKTDNRIANLRIATRAENLRNSTVHKDSKTGYKGVRPNPDKAGSFIASIYVNGKAVNLGVYSDVVEAHGAYVSAAVKYFGEFASGGECEKQN